jgi:tripartite-type tricarboxylate transporter receptor subunit TctC
MTANRHAKHLVECVLGPAIAAMLAAAPAHAQQYPAKPVRLVVPFGVGGSVDTLSRLVAQPIGDAWGQQILVDVRPGAGSLIGTDVVAKSKPDGYTLMMANSSSAMAVSVYKTVPYDIMRDFTAVGMIGYTPHLTVVHPSLQVKNLKELISLAKARPGEINYSSAGAGVGSHLAVEVFKSVANIDVTHVPYKGAAPAVMGLVAGEVSLMVVNLVSAAPHVKTSKLRALGVADSKRSPVLPEVPTMAEAGLPFEFVEWYGIIAPANTPQEVIAKWNSEINRIVGARDFQERLANLGATPKTGTPAEFNAYLRSEVARYAKVVKSANIKVD